MLTQVANQGRSRQRGRDNLTVAAIAADAAMPLGHTVTSMVLSAQAIKRLANLANSFQRIVWNNLTLEVCCGFPTTVSGGVVICFCADPTDSPPTSGGQAAVQWAMAQPFHLDMKWWESEALRIRMNRSLLFTSISTEARTFSPGVFWAISKGAPGSAGVITINVSWDVTLSEPTLEDGNTPAEVSVSSSIVLDRSVIAHTIRLAEPSGPVVNIPGAASGIGAVLRLKTPRSIMSMKPEPVLLEIDGFVRTRHGWIGFLDRDPRPELLSSVEIVTADGFEQTNFGHFSDGGGPVCRNGEMLFTMPLHRRMRERTLTVKTQGGDHTVVLAGQWEFTSDEPTVDDLTIAQIRLTGEQ